MDDKVRWGILGTGKIARDPRGRARRDATSGELVAVGSRDAERAAAFAAEFEVRARLRQATRA